MQTEIMKTCCLCNREMSIAYFVKDHRKKHGVGYRCKECDTIRQAQYSAKPRVKKMRALYQRGRYWIDPEKNAARRSRFRSEHEQGVRFDRDPIKEAARRALSTAVRSGKILKPSVCQECGAGGVIHGHHEDYSKPLAVDWLCPLCHGKRHRKYREDSLLAAKSKGGDADG